MIQFNLLPDVKQQYLKVRRMQHLVITVSFIAIGLSVFVLLVLISTVDILQKKSISDLKNQIDTTSAQIKSTPDLGKMLTVQTQLQQLTNLHNQKPVASRVFGYIRQLTPPGASITQLAVDYTQNTMTITGSAPSLNVVKNYVETLKLSNFTQSGSSATSPAFSNEVLTQFSRTPSGATYVITTSFDPTIFNSAANVTLKVPRIIAPPSTITQSAQIFQKPGGQ